MLSVFSTDSSCGPLESGRTFVTKFIYRLEMLKGYRFGHKLKLLVSMCKQARDKEMQLAPVHYRVWLHLASTPDRDINFSGGTSASLSIGTPTHQYDTFKTTFNLAYNRVFTTLFTTLFSPYKCMFPKINT